MSDSPAFGAALLTSLFDIEATLGRIEVLLWLVLLLLGSLLFVLLRRTVRKDGLSSSGSNDELQIAFDKGEFDVALNILEIRALEKPADPSILFWQGCCYFRLKRWDEAVKKFEEAVLIDPPYRRHVRDYMEFIELNELVPGVTGYLERGRNDDNSDT